MSAIRSASSTTTISTSPRSACRARSGRRGGRAWRRRCRRRAGGRPAGRRSRRRRRGRRPGAAGWRPAGRGPARSGPASSRVGARTRAFGRRRPGPADPGDERDAEGQGLARAGGGPTADVAAGEGGRDGGRLDRERLGDALLGETRGDVGGDAEVGERDRQETAPVKQWRPIGAPGRRPDRPPLRSARSDRAASRLLPERRGRRGEEVSKSRNGPSASQPTITRRTRVVQPQTSSSAKWHRPSRDPRRPRRPRTAAPTPSRRGRRRCGSGWAGAAARPIGRRRSEYSRTRADCPAAA